jgi:hypothetical protein
MAGTLFGLSLSQRVDLNSLPAVGWLLYLYQANTSTPVNSYFDQGLTALNPWPLQADAYGMMSQFWLADGSYRARATSNDGSQTYFDMQNILALTPYVPSSGGGGPSIDVTQVFQTGDVMWVETQGTRTGWVRDNGRTLGAATSGASERANADCQNLFTYLWNTFADAVCPVVSGRGASAAADWAANKQITLPDKRGCQAMGLDDMGNTAAGRMAGVPIITSSGTVTQPGCVVGENIHLLATTEMPAHNHPATATDSGHSHTAVTHENVFASAGATTNITAGATGGTNKVVTVDVATGTANITASTSNTGGGVAHNITNRAVLGTFYRKL